MLKHSLLSAAEAVLLGTPKSKKRKPVSSIGTQKESSLHRSLKFRYSGEDGETEAQTGLYVCDACTSDGELIEVQTGSFGPLKEKVKDLCTKNKVRIIHPIINQKYIELYDKDGRFKYRRKSPRKGTPWDLFEALIYAPLFPLQKKLTIELAVVDVIEKRISDGKGSWRRKGVRIADRTLSAWLVSIILKSPKDYHRFLPFKKNKQFTVKDLAAAAGIKVSLARKVIYVFDKIGIVEKAGKEGRSPVYKWS